MSTKQAPPLLFEGQCTATCDPGETFGYVVPDWKDRPIVRCQLPEGHVGGHNNDAAECSWGTFSCDGDNAGQRVADHGDGRGDA